MFALVGLGLVFLVFVVMGYSFGTWRYVAALAALVGSLCVVFWLRGGVYGEGWEEGGILVGGLLPAAILAGVVLGAVISRLSRKPGSP